MGTAIIETANEGARAKTSDDIDLADGARAKTSDGTGMQQPAWRTDDNGARAKTSDDHSMQQPAWTKKCMTGSRRSRSKVDVDKCMH